MRKLPVFIERPHTASAQWDRIPLGVDHKGKEVSWDLSSAAHALVTGSTGSGKSVLRSNVLLHCFQHKDRFRILGVDPTRIGLRPYIKYDDDIVMSIATDLEDGVDTVRLAYDEMVQRYQDMQNQQVNHFLDLADSPQALLVIIDEAYIFLAPERVSSLEGQERDRLHREAFNLIHGIARLGRAAGVHLLLSTQRPDPSVISSNLKDNLLLRVTVGRMARTPSQLVLGSDTARGLPADIKGRSVLSVHGNEVIFQGYFISYKQYNEQARRASFDVSCPESSSPSVSGGKKKAAKTLAVYGAAVALGVALAKTVSSLTR